LFQSPKITSREWLFNTRMTTATGDGRSTLQNSRLRRAKHSVRQRYFQP
jgi:hypothetical protein